MTRPVLSAEVATMLMAVFFLVSGLFQFIGSIWVAFPAGAGKRWTELSLLCWACSFLRNGLPQDSG